MDIIHFDGLLYIPKELRQELRVALVEYVKIHDGTMAKDAIRGVARDHNVDKSHVAAAMWSLVEDRELYWNGLTGKLSLSANE